MIKGERVVLVFAEVSDKYKVYEMLVSEDNVDNLFNDDHPAPTWDEFNEELDALFTGSVNDEGNYLLIQVDGTTIGSVSYAFCSGKIPTAELDIWIESYKDTGKGYGSETIKLLMNFVYEEFGVSSFMLRPWIKNQNAINAYLSVGFKEIDYSKLINYYSSEELAEYGDGDYGKEETVNLIYELKRG